MDLTKVEMDITMGKKLLNGIVNGITGTVSRQVWVFPAVEM